MSNFGLSCDVCNRENIGVTWVNGMKFCAKCYQETFGNKMVFTNETGKFVDLLNTEMYELKISNLEHKLDEKDQRIAELEEQLKNAIVPKFKIGHEVWWVDTRVNSFNEQRYRIESYLIDSIVITKEQFRYYGDDGSWLGDNELFATKEEAQAKLEELKGENK